MAELTDRLADMPRDVVLQTLADEVAAGRARARLNKTDEAVKGLQKLATD